MQIYGSLQNAKRKKKADECTTDDRVKRNTRFARPNMNHFKMLSSLITSKNEMGIDITTVAISVQTILVKNIM